MRYIFVHLILGICAGRSLGAVDWKDDEVLPMREPMEFRAIDPDIKSKVFAYCKSKITQDSASDEHVSCELNAERCVHNALENRFSCTVKCSEGTPAELTSVECRPASCLDRNSIRCRRRLREYFENLPANRADNACSLDVSRCYKYAKRKCEQVCRKVLCVNSTTVNYGMCSSSDFGNASSQFVDDYPLDD